MPHCVHSGTVAGCGRCSLDLADINTISYISPASIISLCSILCKYFANADGSIDTDSFSAMCNIVVRGTGNVGGTILYIQNILHEWCMSEQGNQLKAKCNDIYLSVLNIRYCSTRDEIDSILNSIIYTYN